MSTRDDITVSDEEFDAFLNGEDGLAQLLKKMPQAEPSAQLDAAILAEAKAELAAKPAIPSLSKVAANDARIPEGKPFKPSWNRTWRVPLGVAASLLVTVQLVHMEITDERAIPNKPALLLKKESDVDVKLMPLHDANPAVANNAPAPMAAPEMTLPAPAKPYVAPRVPLPELSKSAEVAAAPPPAAVAAPVVPASDIAPAPRMRPADVVPESAAAPASAPAPAPAFSPPPPPPASLRASARAPSRTLAPGPDFTYRVRPSEDDDEADSLPAPAPVASYAAPTQPPAYGLIAPAEPLVTAKAEKQAVPETDARRRDTPQRVDVTGSAIRRSDSDASSPQALSQQDKVSALPQGAANTPGNDADARLSKIDALLKAGANQEALVAWHQFRDTYPDYKVPDALREKIDVLLK